MANNPRIVITGGPGSGKTTLIEALASRGLATEPEAGRAVIQAQQAMGGDALPWADRAGFASLMLDSDIAAHVRSSTVSGPVFFDRGIPDIVGYLELCGLPIPARLDEAARTLRYKTAVFIAPVWPEIFSQDEERRQDIDEATRTYDAMVQTYPRYGYSLDEIPKSSLEGRVAFILKHVMA